MRGATRRRRRIHDPPGPDPAARCAARRHAAGRGRAARRRAPGDGADHRREIDYAIWGDNPELASQKALVDAFMVKHPEIKVNLLMSDWDTYWDKLQTSLAGGDAPDVFAMDGPLYPDYQSRDVLLDLTPYIERDAST